MRFARLIPIAIAALALASPVLAQDEKAKDHPRFSGMPSYEISNADVQEFGAGDFDTAPGAEQKHVEGKYWKIDYSLKEGAKKAGPLQIGRNYTALLLAKGGRRLT